MRPLYVPVRLAVTVVAVAAVAGCMSVGDDDGRRAKPSHSAGQRGGEAPDGGAAVSGGGAGYGGEAGGVADGREDGKGRGKDGDDADGKGEPGESGAPSASSPVKPGASAPVPPRPRADRSAGRRRPGAAQAAADADPDHPGAGAAGAQPGTAVLPRADGRRTLLVGAPADRRPVGPARARTGGGRAGLGLGRPRAGPSDVPYRSGTRFALGGSGCVWW